jgi:hypothetical protein
LIHSSQIEFYCGFFPVQIFEVWKFIAPILQTRYFCEG